MRKNGGGTGTTAGKQKHSKVTSPSMLSQPKCSDPLGTAAPRPHTFPHTSSQHLPPPTRCRSGPICCCGVQLRRLSPLGSGSRISRAGDGIRHPGL